MGKNAIRDFDISGANTNANAVAGNMIGLDFSGTSSITNNNSGAAIFGGAKNNIIGGTSPGARNFISGHAQYGLFISDADTTGNLVQGNTIGLNVMGVAKPNANTGNFQPAVAIFNDAHSNTIGGSTIDASNIIAEYQRRGWTL